MANAFDSYLRAKESAMREGQNAMAMEQFVKKSQRDQQLRDILAGAYTPGTPAIPQPGGPMVGPTPSGAPMPDAMAGPDIPAQAGGMDMRGALDAMYQGGFGPEAMGYESKLASQGGMPASLKELAALQGMTPEQRKQFWNIKRGQQTVDIGGVPHAFVPGSGFQPISTREAELGAATEKERSRKLGAEAAKVSGESAAQVGKIRQNVVNLREVKRLIDKEGAITGPVADKFPSFRAASIELDNMQKQLGLDVIGAVTFGALSKGELDLALSKALPTHLTGPALSDWTKRKIEAQEKLADYFEDQSIYLSKPGNSVASWLEMQKSKRTKPTGNTNKQALKWATENPNDPRSIQILKKLEAR